MYTTKVYKKIKVFIFGEIDDPILVHWILIFIFLEMVFII